MDRSHRVGAGGDGRNVIGHDESIIRLSENFKNVEKQYLKVVSDGIGSNL